MNNSKKIQEDENFNNTNFEFRDFKTLFQNISSPHATANGIQYERANAELKAKLATEICKNISALNLSIEKSTISNNLLNKKILWLNIILTIATCVGATATAIIAFQDYIKI